MTAAAWDALVGTAVLGTGRRTLDVAALPPDVAAAAESVAQAVPDTDPAGRLLDIAALLTIYRRAGRTVTALAAGLRPPEPAPPPDSRPVPAAAAERLGDLIAGFSAGTSGLLLIWLEVAGAAGFEAPAQQLPALLRLATRRPDLAPAVRAVLGTRGRWLAQQHPQWHDQALDAKTRYSAGDPAHNPALEPAPDPAPDRAQDPAWTHGTLAQRRTFFAGLREHDPDAARDLLQAGAWTSFDGPARAAFTAELHRRLSAADEPVLDIALADRRQDVRAAAADLLARLPGSGYVRELTALARSCLRVERVRMRRTLVVTLPVPGPDTPALPALPAWMPPRPQAGPGVQLLLRLLSAVPPTVWEQSLGAGPADLVGLPVSDDLGGAVHLGWAGAALRQQDAAWASALIREHGGSSAVQLLPAVPPAHRPELVIATLTAAGTAAATPRTPAAGGTTTGRRILPDAAEAMLRQCPQPWTPDLVAAVLRWLARLSTGSAPWPARDLLRYLGQALPPDPATLDAVVRLPGRLPPGSPWHQALATVAETMIYHRQMLEELS